MLICPHCQFENTDSNNFCQECGTSLTQKTCHVCGSAVPFSAASCPSCGAPSQATWIAVASFVESESPEALQPEAASFLASLTVTQAGIFLDQQQRYQILDSIPVDFDAADEGQLQVLDWQPFRQSPLQVSAIALATLEQAASDSTSLPNLIETATLGADTPQAAIATGEEAGILPTHIIPKDVQPYLDLGAKFYQVLPEVHDAWEQSGRSVILLADFSTLLPISEAICPNPNSATSNTDPLDPEALGLQILYWLNEVVTLWEALTPWHCCQSLVELSNLRIDEDQILHLQRLYNAPPNSAPTLQDLGRIWQLLLSQAQINRWSDLTLLLDELQTGKILTTDELRSCIKKTAHTLQAYPPSTVPMPENSNAGSPDPSMLRQSVAPTASDPTAIAASTTNLKSAGVPRSPDQQYPEDPDTDAYDEFSIDEDEADNDNDDLPTVVLPMQLSNLDYAGCTDTGRQREHNEDYFGVETQISKVESPSSRIVHATGVYVLCDGMGGHAGGEVASALAVDTLRRYFQLHWQDAASGTGAKSRKLPPLDVIREGVLLANKTIYDVNQQNARSGSGRMGTTLVMVLLQDTEVAVAHVGDSRLYRFTRKRGLEQITVDHEVGQREIQRGVEPEIAYGRPDAYQLTQALGPRDENFVSPDIQFMELNEDTLLLLCSDGMTDNNLLEEHYQSHIEPLLSSQANLERGVNQLVELANQHNGHDNITALVIRAKVRPNLDRLR
jgi:protein phosphatase